MRVMTEGDRTIETTLAPCRHTDRPMTARAKPCGDCGDVDRPRVAHDLVWAANSAAKEPEAVR